jgi:hypothetical protein
MDNRTIKPVLIIVALVVAAIVALKILSLAMTLVFKVILPLAFVALIIYGVYWFIKKRR